MDNSAVKAASSQNSNKNEVLNEILKTIVWKDLEFQFKDSKYYYSFKQSRDNQYLLFTKFDIDTQRAVSKNLYKLEKPLQGYNWKEKIKTSGSRANSRYVFSILPHDTFSEARCFKLDYQILTQESGFLGPKSVWRTNITWVYNKA